MSALHYVVVRCSVLQCVTYRDDLIVNCIIEFHVCIAVRCSMLECVALWCSVLQCVRYRNVLFVLLLIQFRVRAKPFILVLRPTFSEVSVMVILYNEICGKLSFENFSYDSGNICTVPTIFNITSILNHFDQVMSWFHSIQERTKKKINWLFLRKWRQTWLLRIVIREEWGALVTTVVHYILWYFSSLTEFRINKNK